MCVLGSLVERTVRCLCLILLYMHAVGFLGGEGGQYSDHFVTKLAVAEYILVL